MVNETEVLESPDLTPLDLYLCGWMKNEVHKKKKKHTRRIALSYFFFTMTDTIAPQNTDFSHESVPT